MKKIFVLAIFASLAGCSNIQINGTICDNVGVGSEPVMQNGMPQECLKYDEKEAQKAFDKVKEKKKADVEDIIEFEKGKKE